jgi:hypothetical protein
MSPSKLARAAAALFVIASIASGCDHWPFRTTAPRMPGIFQPPETVYRDADRRQAGPQIIPASASSEPMPHTDAFTIRFNTYCADEPGGENRRIAAFQQVTVITDELRDPDGLAEGSQSGGIGRDLETPPRSWLDFTATIRNKDLLMEGPKRLGPHKVSIRFHSGSANPIDWEVTVTIDNSGPEPQYQAFGHWRDLYAAELIINGVRVYKNAAPGFVVIPDPSTELKSKKKEDPKPLRMSDEFRADGLLRRPIQRI